MNRVRLGIVKVVLFLVAASLLAACGVPVKHYTGLARGEIASCRFRSSYEGAVKDVPYTNDAVDDQKLDIFKTGSEGLSPVFVFIHGGSWKSGTREEYAALGKTLSAEGIVTVNVDYRLYPDVRYPLFMEDCAAALNWVMEHIQEYGGDPDRVVVAGHSAGAHIVGLLLVQERFRKLLHFDIRKLKGAVLLSGAYKFAEGLNVPDKLIRNVMETKENYNEAQPLFFVRPDVPPVLLVVGDRDSITEASQSETFEAAMKKAGAPILLKEIKGGDHFSVVLDLMPSRKGEAYKIVTDFLRAQYGSTSAPKE